MQPEFRVMLLVMLMPLGRGVDIVQAFRELRSFVILKHGMERCCRAMF